MKVSGFFSKVALFLCFGSLAPRSLEARTWHLINGATIEGEVMKYDEQGVIIYCEAQRRRVRLKAEHLLKQDHPFLKKAASEAKNEAAETNDDDDSITAGDNESDRKELFEESLKRSWPKLVQAPDFEVEVVKESEEEGKYIYRSPHFEFISNAKLTTMPVRRFAQIFESTREYMKALPLGFTKAHQEGKRYKAYLFETKEQYMRAGGPPSSAGVYMSHRDCILIPFESLGLRKAGSGYRVDYDGSNKTLLHELTHQMTDLKYYDEGSRGWFTEGLAEYVANTPYRSGKFMPSNAAKRCKIYVTYYSKKTNRGRALGEDIQVGSLEKFMNMPYSQFAGSNANFNYGVACLLVAHFINFGEPEDLQAYMRAIFEGKPKEERFKALFGGGTFKDGEKAIEKGWRSRGVKLNFE